MRKEPRRNVVKELTRRIVVKKPDDGFAQILIQTAQEKKSIPVAEYTSSRVPVAVYPVAGYSALHIQSTGNPDAGETRRWSLATGKHKPDAGLLRKNKPDEEKHPDERYNSRLTSRWKLMLAIAKRCRSNKLKRQRFAFALRLSRRILRCDNQQGATVFYLTSRGSVVVFEKEPVAGITHMLKRNQQVHSFKCFQVAELPTMKEELISNVEDDK
ncbi:putative inactive receptor kinase [Dorcoceras hygrometricum]|uniref:Putative inactive receptor kinase n=1 Tax=Dorcoceras hygrometricum TaxID=472368 RepID=A0A2Z7A9T6_9LAMI|nr:putative inactive receptor kinase [Dorcoceras hygrometricum]